LSAFIKLKLGLLSGEVVKGLKSVSEDRDDVEELELIFA